MRTIVSNTMALLIAFGQVKGEDKENKDEKQVQPIRSETYFVRSTKYHKTDPNCDPWTMRGQTSTKLTLPKNYCSNDIGNVALDPQFVKEGSLVYETKTKRFFVATTGGTAVIKRTASKRIASKRNLPARFGNALVFDFYAPREIVAEHFTYCYVVPYIGEKPFRNLSKESQKKRLDPNYWLPILEKLYDSSQDSQEKDRARAMIERMKEVRDK